MTSHFFSFYPFSDLNGGVRAEVGIYVSLMGQVTRGTQLDFTRKVERAIGKGVLHQHGPLTPRVTCLHVQKTGLIFSFKIPLWYTLPLFIVKTF